MLDQQTKGFKSSKDFKTRVNKILNKFYIQKKINTIKEDVKADYPTFYNNFFGNANLKEATKCFTKEFKSQWEKGYSLYIDGNQTCFIYNGDAGEIYTEFTQYYYISPKFS